MSKDMAMATAQSQTVSVPKSTAMNVFSDTKTFETALRMANCLASSTVVPKEYQKNPGNCMIAIEMASRNNTSPIMVMQNLYIVNGRPAWSSQWIIAMINSSKRYKTELQFEFGNDPEDDGLSCMAWAEDYNGHKVCGPKITMKLARAEGWLDKNGSKWKTMPKVMIQYRAASFFGRMNCPDMIMGIYSREEAMEMDLVEGEVVPNLSSIMSNPETGEVVEDTIITQEQRQALFDLLKKNFSKEERNAVLQEMLDKEGCESTNSMMTSSYRRVMDELMKRIEAASGEDATTPEAAPSDDNNGNAE